MSALRAEDLDGALLLAQLELADAAVALASARAARPRVRLVAACALLPAEACPCGERLVLPGRALCDLCTREEEHDPEVLAGLETAAPPAARALPRPHRRRPGLRRAVGG